jgi:hypothetical protein
MSGQQSHEQPGSELRVDGTPDQPAQASKREKESSSSFLAAPGAVTPDPNKKANEYARQFNRIALMHGFDLPMHLLAELVALFEVAPREGAASVSPDYKNAEDLHTRVAPTDTASDSSRTAERPVGEVDAAERTDICERCQMHLPLRLLSFGIGVRGGDSAWCAVCKPVLGEEARREVVAIRKAHYARTR